MKIKYPYGYIYCKVLNKTMPIGKEGHPDKNCGWVCDCGQLTKEHPETHDVYWYGENQ